MPIIFRCKHCEQKLSIASRKVGETVKCPSCHKPLVVPEVSQESLPEATEEQPEEQPEGQPQDNLRPDNQTQDDIPQESVTAPKEESEDSEENTVIFRKAETPQDEMDLTPMVDVTFLLLIFFMITASFTIQNKFDWPNPDPDKNSASLKPEEEETETVAVVVIIDEKNEISVDDEVVSDLSQLRDVIERKMRAERKATLVLKVHAKALHEYSIKVVDASKGAGIQTIKYATIGSLDAG